jgi:hypothetical protein
LGDVFQPGFGLSRLSRHDGRLRLLDLNIDFAKRAKSSRAFAGRFTVKLAS